MNKLDFDLTSNTIWESQNNVTGLASILLFLSTFLLSSPLSIDAILLASTLSLFASFWSFSFLTCLSKLSPDEHARVLENRESFRAWWETPKATKKKHNSRFQIPEGEKNSKVNRLVKKKTRNLSTFIGLIQSKAWLNIYCRCWWILASP